MTEGEGRRTESSPSVSVSPAHSAPAAVVIGRDHPSSNDLPFPFPSSLFLNVDARLSPCDLRTMTPSSVSAPDVSSSSEVGPVGGRRVRA